MTATGLEPTALSSQTNTQPFSQTGNLAKHTLIKIYGSVIKSSNFEKLLRITIDSDFAFEEHNNALCPKASQRLRVLSRILQYLSQHKKRILLTTFKMSV